MLIQKVKAEKIFNSRKEETLKVLVKTSNGKYEGSAPSGASIGSYEAVAFPKGVEHAVRFFNKEILLKDMEMHDFDDFIKIEERVDQKEVGGNGVIALESALLKALAKGKVWQLLDKNTKQIPRPVGNCIGGGKHIKNRIGSDFQEFLLVSFDAASFHDAVQANNEIYEHVGELLKKKDPLFRKEVTDEGAWAPYLSNGEILDILYEAVQEVNEKLLGFKVHIGLDVAATSFFEEKKYCYKNYSSSVKEKRLTKKEQIDFLLSLVKKYKIAYLEDPLEENDVEGFSLLKKKVGKNCLIVGDDVTATHPERLEKVITKDAVNAVIIKPNQAGSYIRMKETLVKAQKNKLICVMSHRSGETKDDIIADLSVGFHCPLLKCGIYGKERVVKLERIEKIEYEIKKLKK